MRPPLKKMSEALRTEIKFAKKKQEDISSIIAGYDISGEDLSNSLISNLDMSERDMSKCDISYSKVKLLLHKGTARNCNFMYAEFLPGSSVRGADLRGTNFSGCNGFHVDFAYCDLRNTNFCNTCFNLFSKKAYKAKFSNNFLDLIKRFVDIEGVNEIKDENEMQ